MLENIMVHGDPDAYSLPQIEPRECGTVLKTSIGMSGTVYMHYCRELVVPGMDKCSTCGLKECEDMWAEANEAYGTRYAWRPKDIAFLRAEEDAYRKAAAL